MADYTDVLLINENVIKSVSNISENVSGNYILPAIKLAQDIDLEETIGTQLKEALQKQVFDNALQDTYKALLDNYIQQYLTYATIVQLIPTVAFKIANAGVLVTDDEKMTNVTSTEVDKVKAHYRHLADVYKNRLQRFLVKNYSDYPELHSYKSCQDIKANLYSAASCGLALGGKRGKKL